MLTSRQASKKIPISEAIDRRNISRRDIVAGVAVLGVHDFAQNALAAETRPLAEKLAAYAAALRYEDLDPATIERVESHLIDTLGCAVAAFDERPVRICREIAQSVQLPDSKSAATSCQGSFWLQNLGPLQRRSAVQLTIQSGSTEPPFCDSDWRGHCGNGRFDIQFEIPSA